jgi:hypothetical protein
MTPLCKVSVFLLTMLVSFSVLVCCYSTVYAQDTRLDLDFKKRKLTARIKNTPLKAVLKEIKEEKDIWFDAGYMRDKSLLNKDVSVRFSDVNIDEGLDRILSGINHSLLFRGNKVVGVMLLGKPSTKTYRRRRTTRRRPVRRRSTGRRSARRVSRRP